MSFDEMAAVVEQVAASDPSIRTHASIGQRTGELLLAIDGSPDRWAKIELGVEAFFLSVDRGFWLVDFEWSPPEQTELLSELTEAACRYLHGDFEIREKRSAFGRRRSILVIARASGEALLLKEPR